MRRLLLPELKIVRSFFALSTLVMLGGCSESGGIVEVAWQFDDASLEHIFPQGYRSDTCDLASQSGIRFDLVVRLRVLANTTACAEDPDGADCEAIQSETFPCYRFRGTADPVVISAPPDGPDPGYLMLVEAMINPTDSPAFLPTPACILSPGPRVRKVTPGRITDLELQQFIVADPALTDGTADLASCRNEASP